MRYPLNHLHFIGIGGIGMSGLAELMQMRGAVVSGSDLVANERARQLAKLGAAVYEGHDAKHIEGANLVIYSSAVTEQNPERAAALSANIPTISRGELLAELFNRAQGITVAGTHGKTTTSSILCHLLCEAGLDPTCVVGGVLNRFSSPVHAGSGPYFVAESDESDASFLLLRPHSAVITNIDADHLVTYDDDFSKLQAAFLQFANRIDPKGFLVINKDDPVLSELMQQSGRTPIAYGFSKDADYVISDYQQNGLYCHFVVTAPEGESWPLALPLPGRHNAANAAAAFVMAHQFGVSYSLLQKIMGTFAGVQRRFTVHGDINVAKGSALVIDDYGHHPEEIAATIQALRDAWPDRRLVMIFQPHRYTRTRDHFDGFANVLGRVDRLLMLDVYSASESPIAGADTECLCQAIVAKGGAEPARLPAVDRLPQDLLPLLQANDIVIFQGAGSVGPMASKIYEQHKA